MDKAKVELISNLPIPKCVRDIRSFLGHAGFYRRFIKDFSAMARPLFNLLAKDVPFAWSQACEAAFDKLKIMLVSPLSCDLLIGPSLLRSCVTLVIML